MVAFRLPVMLAAAALLGLVPVALASGLLVNADSLTAWQTATVVPTTSCSVTASADTYGDELLSLTNFGTSSELHVRSELLANRRTFVRFDLSVCSIPAGAKVREASLVLFLATAPASGRTHEAVRITETWDETTLTWLNQPSAASSGTASTTTGTTSGVELTWAVTPDLQAFVDGSFANHGWLIRDAAEGATTARQAAFTSREQTPSSYPKLVVEYHP